MIQIIQWNLFNKKKTIFFIKILNIINKKNKKKFNLIFNNFFNNILKIKNIIKKINAFKKKFKTF